MNGICSESYDSIVSSSSVTVSNGCIVRNVNNAVSNISIVSNVRAVGNVGIVRSVGSVIYD